MNNPRPISARRDGADMRHDVRPSVPLTDFEAQVVALHERYTARTGFDLTLNVDRQRIWREWIAFGNFSGDDLALVVGYLRAHIARGERNDGALKFSNLIGKPDTFEEDLALAKKWRKPAAPASRRIEPGHHQPATGDDRTPEERASSFRAAVSS